MGGCGLLGEGAGEAALAGLLAADTPVDSGFFLSTSAYMTREKRHQKLQFGICGEGL